MGSSDRTVRPLPLTLQNAAVDGQVNHHQNHQDKGQSQKIGA